MADASSIAGYIKDRYRDSFYYSNNIYYNSGNVGIGTATLASSAKFEVWGNAFISNGLWFNDPASSLANATSAGSYSSSAATGDFVLRSAASTKLLLQSGGGASAIAITSGGNVGIGTASPAGKLDINSGFVYIDGFKQPFSRTGTVNGAYYIDIPTMFELATTTVHTCEIVYTWYKTGSVIPNANLYGIVNGVGYSPIEVGYRDGSSGASLVGYSGNVIVRNIEEMIDHSTKIRMNRVLVGGGNRRHHYTCDTVYCYTGVGSFINNSIGQISNMPSTNQIQFIRIQLSSSTAYMYGSWTATYYHV